MCHCSDQSQTCTTQGLLYLLIDDFQIEPKVENAENNVNELNQCESIAIGTSPVLQQKCCSSWHHSLSEDKVHNVVR